MAATTLVVEVAVGAIEQQPLDCHVVEHLIVVVLYEHTIPELIGFDGEVLDALDIPS